MEIKKSFGKKVKEKRLALSLTQEGLAEKIGISAKSLSQIELGNNFVSAENLEAICVALGVTPRYLFDFQDDEIIDKYHIINEKMKNDKVLVSKLYDIMAIIE